MIILTISVFAVVALVLWLRKIANDPTDEQKYHDFVESAFPGHKYGSR